MLSRPLLNQIVANEALVRGLADPEARVLVEWLVEQAEEHAGTGNADPADVVRRLCRRGRAIGRFVTLWCHQEARGAAAQLAASERFDWPLPVAGIDPCTLMQNILDWELRADRTRGT